jgi:hypothetical protein
MSKAINAGRKPINSGKGSARRVRKHHVLDESKLERAKEIFGVETETEAIEQALNRAIQEHDHNIACWKAIEKFVKSGADIKDVFGHMER